VGNIDVFLTHQIFGSAKIDVNVGASSAPTKGGGGSLFKKVPMQRNVLMTPAAVGPPETGQ
jgi:hypothetical protein